jgi:hypothetical protein
MMADAAAFRAAALALEGVTQAPHVDRTAFRRRTIFATLAADGLTANLRFAPEEQAFRCAARPDAFAPVPGGWGALGWTTATLAALDAEALAGALAAAWSDAGPRPGRAGGSRARGRASAKPIEDP